MECKVVHQLELRDLAGRTVDQHLVIGQVVGVHIDERAIVSTGVDTTKLAPVARCGGPGDYAVVDRVFEMLRPRS
jgi:flavin reductase (DIM6/NTAB) family NADH-FMN oxidoreductase RutF